MLERPDQQVADLMSHRVTQFRYDVASDGQRFLAALAAERDSAEPLTLVQNWTSGLRKR
jgi:hypothetical protein